MKTVELNVTGMMCVRCENNVAKALEAVDGVEKAVADRTEDRVLVRLSNDDIDPSTLTAAVEGANNGWKATFVK